ncbi:tegument protein VP13/14 [Gallid alphaherpesvirus 1]|nr:tegument protein VP13/14 [Gallid alphaherpesvirus 1]
MTLPHRLTKRPFARRFCSVFVIQYSETKLDRYNKTMLLFRPDSTMRHSGGDANHRGIRPRRKSIGAFSAREKTGKRNALTESNSSPADMLDPFSTDKEFGGKWTVDGPADITAEVLSQAWDVLQLVKHEDAEEERVTYESKPTPIQPFNAWPDGPSWNAQDFTRAPIVYPSAEVLDAEALKVGAFVSRVLQCVPFTRSKKSVTVRDAQSFLGDSFWRIMQNVYTVVLRQHITRLRHPSSKSIVNCNDPLWYAYANQFHWRGMRVPSLKLASPPEENIQHGPMAAVFRNAGAGLFLWPAMRAAFEERDKRLLRACLSSLDIMDAAVLASFPFYWRGVQDTSRFEPALGCLSEYFALVVLLAETVLATMFDHVLVFMRALADGNFDDYDETRYIDPVKNEYLNGAEGTLLRGIMAFNTALAVVCANTYSTIRKLPSVATSACNVAYRTETLKARRPGMSDIYRILQKEFFFYIAWLQRVATHANFCLNILKRSVDTGAPPFLFRASSEKRLQQLNKMLCPLLVPIQYEDFSKALGSELKREKLETFVKAISSDRDPRGSLRFLISDHAREIIADGVRFKPVIDEPVRASVALSTAAAGKVKARRLTSVRAPVPGAGAVSARRKSEI